MKRVYWATNFGNWVKFQAPPPNEKVKTAEKAEQKEAPPQGCAGCTSAAVRAAEMVAALTQGWAVEKTQREGEMNRLQEQVASLREQLKTKESALKEARENNRAVTLASAPMKKKRSRSKKKPEKKVEPVDLTRVVPTDLQLPGVGGRVHPEFRQTVLSRYEPGDESTFPDAAYLFPKKAAQEKTKHRHVHEFLEKLKQEQAAKNQQNADAKDPARIGNLHQAMVVDDGCARLNAAVEGLKRKISMM